eukprot:scaffold189765_cov36-Tisochrysis_lutea.AAC.4
MGPFIEPRCCSRLQADAGEVADGRCPRKPLAPCWDPVKSEICGGGRAACGSSERPHPLHTTSTACNYDHGRRLGSLRARRLGVPHSQCR